MYLPELRSYLERLKGKQRITEDNGTFTEYREKAQKRYVSGLLKWLYYIILKHIINTGKFSI